MLKFPFPRRGAPLGATGPRRSSAAARTETRHGRRLGTAGLLLLALTWAGCASAPPRAGLASRPFVFAQDTFAFSNELVWAYHVDAATGRTTHTRTVPPPTYAHHCFPMAKAVRQFFLHARFDPAQPAPDDATCRRLIRRIVSTNPRRASVNGSPVVIPGYASLREFSRAREALLKAGCGGAWQSYCQRGNWRMVFPFGERHQARMARQLAAAIQGGRLPIVHLVRFPRLSINHALVLFAAVETEREVRFAAYDPNTPARPAEIIFDRTARRFQLPANHYFAGGRVDVYEIYSAWNY